MTAKHHWSYQDQFDSINKMRAIDFRDKIAKAICTETCAFKGEPPCWSIHTDRPDGEGKYPAMEWPNPYCDEPGCHALAEAVIAAIEGDLHRGDAG